MQKQVDTVSWLKGIHFSGVGRSQEARVISRLTDLTSSSCEAGQAGAGEGRVAGDAVVNALTSVQTRSQVRAH